jgi:hypothetical protein
MTRLRRWWRRLTIRHRALVRGNKITSGFGFVTPSSDDEKANWAFRNLVRLLKIKKGKKPFEYFVGNLDEYVWLCDSILRSYGNIARKTP